MFNEFINKHKDIVDFFFKLATMSIAVFNILFAIYIFKLKNKKDDSDKEKDRRISLLKTLVLDHNLKYFYDFFDELAAVLEELKTGLDDAEKSTIKTKADVKFILLRRQFTDTFLAVDKSLYTTIIDKMDILQDELTYCIFDAGVNLTHEPKFNEMITNKLIDKKTAILSMLFMYRGDEVV